MSKSYLNLISLLTKESDIYSLQAVDTDIFSNKWDIEKIDYCQKYNENIYELKLIKRKHPRSVKFSDSIFNQSPSLFSYFMYTIFDFEYKHFKVY